MKLLSEAYFTGGNIMDQLGLKIKALRKSLKMTQGEFCCKILNKSTMSKIENNIIIPSLPQLEHIASMLNMTISELLQPSDIPPLFVNTKKSHIQIECLYNDEKYLDIIDIPMPINFFSCFYKGMSYYKLDLNSKAEKYLCQCEKLFNKMTEHEKFYNVENLGIALNSLRNLNPSSLTDSSCLTCYKRILEYLKMYNGKKYKIYYCIINNISAYYMCNENYEEGINFIEDFLKVNTKLNYTHVSASIHSNLSVAKFAMRNYGEAIDHIKKAIFFYKYAGEILSACKGYSNLFIYYLYNKDYDKCSNLIDYSYKELNFPDTIENFKVLELMLLYNIGDIEKLALCSKKINRNAIDGSLKYDYLFLLGRMNLFLGRYKVATSYYKKCEKYLKSVDRYIDLSILYKDMYYINNNEDFLEMHKKYVLLSKSRSTNTIHPDITINSQPMI